MTKTLKTLSESTKRLLAAGESASVDFKQTAKSITPDDLVAFANSETGGVLLVGVKEKSEENGRQFGQVIGHPIGDSEVSLILGKALSCHPPVRVDIQFENTNRKPIIRIDIPSSEVRPHCSEKGTYTIRNGNRNIGLRPQQLLAIFMDAEAATFSKRFSEAANEIKIQMASVASVVEDLEDVISDKIDQISWNIDSAESEAQDAASTVREALAYSSAAFNRTKDNEVRLDALLKHLSVVDPIRSKAEAEIRSSIREHLSGRSLAELREMRQPGRPTSLSASNLPAYINRDDVSRIFFEVLNDLLSETGSE